MEQLTQQTVKYSQTALMISRLLTTLPTLFVTLMVFLTLLKNNSVGNGRITSIRLADITSAQTIPVILKSYVAPPIVLKPLPPLFVLK